MKPSDFNSSSTYSTFYYAECDYNGLDQPGGTSMGLVVLFATYTLELVIGGPPNFWLLWHILKKRSKSGSVLPADFLPLHMVFAQILFYIVPLLCLPNHYLWRSEGVMDVITVLNSTVLIMKPLLLSLVSMELYMAVVRPLVFIRTTKRHYRWGCVVAIWCIYIVLMVQALHDRRVYLISVVQVPVLAVDTFCCVSILTALRKPPPKDRLKEQREMNSMKRRAFIGIAVNQTVLTFNYLPFVIVWPVGRLVSHFTMKCELVPLALAAASSCGYLQPLLYLLRLGLCRCTCKK